MKKTILYMLPLTILLITACDRTEDEFEGPALQDVFGSFNVVEDFTVSSGSVDFANGEEMTFAALFNNQVYWEVHIDGLSSCAHKVISGISNDINSANSAWQGTTTDLPMFGAEDCAVRADIYNLNQDSLLIQFFDTITVISPYEPEAFIVADFENGLDPTWERFVQTGADMFFGTDSTGKSGQGEYYLRAAGEVSWDWLILLWEVEHDEMQDGDLELTPLSQNAEEVYFNMMIDIPLTTGEKFLLLRFDEDENGDGVFTSSSEDALTYRIDGLDPGWQLVSIPYSELLTEENGTPTNGDGLRSPHQLSKIEFLQLADPSSGFYELKVDFMCFTEGSPLQP